MPFLGHSVYVGVVAFRNKDISMLVNTLIWLINFSHLYFSQVLQKIMRILSLQIDKSDEKEMDLKILNNNFFLIFLELICLNVFPWYFLLWWPHRGFETKPSSSHPQTQLGSRDNFLGGSIDFEVTLHCIERRLDNIWWSSKFQLELESNIEGQPQQLRFWSKIFRNLDTNTFEVTLKYFEYFHPPCRLVQFNIFVILWFVRISCLFHFHLSSNQPTLITAAPKLWGRCTQIQSQNAHKSKVKVSTNPINRKCIDAQIRIWFLNVEC